MRIRRVHQVLNKRALGWISWSLRRRKEHRAQVLEALLDDLGRVSPDHVAVTGDLTNLGLPEEVEQAAAWLHRLGDPAYVSVVPGNHDAYVPEPGPDAWLPWAPYLQSDSSARNGPSGAMNIRHFPSLRVRGPLALIGVSSARPSPLFRATGRLGGPQRERLERLLGELAGSGLCRILLIHHPPLDDSVSRRRRLTDSPELAALLARTGVELVLHGHTHRATLSHLAGPAGSIPVVGVPSASAIGHRPERRARYHLYRFEHAPTAPGFRVTCSVRGFDAATGRFGAEAERPL